ncbi:MAG: drug resistance transporter, Bcr/CflA subfamily [Xanthobacteraceae bacterium]|nr:drug resistance transporter, Bcr/CflA subfamily [Xanthobacteraceae bacterium]
MPGPLPADSNAQNASNAPEARAAAAHPWRLLALLMAMTSIAPMALNILVPAVPGLASRLNTDAATVQLTVSLFLFAIALSQLTLGPLSDRYGRRPVVLGGLAVAVVASLGAIMAESVGSLIAARMAQALGASAGVVIGRAIIRDLFGRERAASMIGLVTTVMVVAPMVSPMIGGLLDTAFGWQAIFGFVAAAAFLVLIWAAITLPETNAPQVNAMPGQYRTDLAALLRNAPFWGYVGGAAFGSASFFSFLGGGPHVVVSMMGRSSAEYGFWFAFTAFGFMAGNFLTSRLTQRHGVDTMIKVGIGFELVGAAVALVVAEMFFTAGPWIIFVPQMVVGFGNGVLLPNCIAGAVSVRPHAAGAASGITGFVQMTLGALAAQFTGWVIAGAMLPLPMTLTILVFTAATALSFGVLTRKR